MRLSDVLYHITQPAMLMQSPLITEFYRQERRYPSNSNIHDCVRALCTDWQSLQILIMAMSQEAQSDHR